MDVFKEENFPSLGDASYTKKKWRTFLWLINRFIIIYI